MSNKLSVVIITKNEEDKIARCINSVKWADEILVIDDESTDRTGEIARALNAKVIRRPLKEDFSSQRNFGMDKANGNWILHMDADEIVTDKLREEINHILSRGSDFSAFQFKRKEFFLGHFMRYGGWHIDEIKLFKKGFCKYVRSIHERPHPYGRIGHIDADIEHHPFSSIFQFIDRQNKYTSLEARSLFKERSRISRKEIKYNLLIKPVKIFWKSYIKKKGYKDGFYGLIYAVLNLFRHFLRWAKYWEIINSQEGDSSENRGVG